MSRTKPTQGEAIMLNFDCTQCGAAAGDWCTTDQNTRAYQPARWASLHSPRFYAATDHGLLPIQDSVP